MQTFADSPHFIRQQMADDFNDVFNIDTTLYNTTKTEPSTSSSSTQTSTSLLDKYTNNNIDIHEVSFISDGKTLNATLWLKNFDKTPFVDYLSYGMYIDVDGSFKNGIKDTDYATTISWDKAKGNWSRSFDEATSSVEIKHINKIDNYTGFFGKGDGYAYVQISADLSKMEYPQNYDITFYTIYQKGNRYFSDVTNGYHIPPLKSVISLHLNPNPIDLRPGDEKTVKLQINSTTPSEPVVYFRINNQTADIKYSFDKDQLRIPPFGMVNTFLKILNSGNTTDRMYVLPIVADIIIPYPTAFPQYAASNNINPSRYMAVHSTNSTEQTNLILSTLPSEYNLSITPNPLELRPGDEKNLQVTIKSLTNLNSHAVIYAKQFNPLSITFTPNTTRITPLGWATSTLHIKVPESFISQPFTLPIMANFTIEDTLSSNNSRITHLNYPNSIYNIVNKELDFTITILPPLSLGERISNIYSTWISPINGIWTFLAGLAAVITPLILRKKRKEHKQQEEASKDNTENQSED